MKRFLSLITLLVLALSGQAQQYYLLVGTYTTGTSKGIYVYRFDASTGKTTPVGETDVENPSYLTFSPDGRFVYAVNENPSGTGGVTALSFDTLTGNLHLLNRQSSEGEFPCYVATDATGKWITVANYGGGNLSAYRVADDGSLGGSAQLIQHEGKGANAKRQEKPHVHSTVFTPDQRYVVSADLGLDKVYVYNFNPDMDEPLTPASTPTVSVRPGSGPRHIAFSPDHRYMYLITELSGEVHVFGYAKGRFTPIEHVPTVLKDTSADKGSADLHLSPDGRFLYASDRGNTNDIVVFEVHPGSGKLKRVGSVSCGGVTPRNFTIDPTGHFLLVANQRSDNVVIFKRDMQTGLLTPTGDQLQIGNPVCLKWWPVPSAH
ncbi:lactonase family protein [Dinghuibacter silviterrae]|uniref:6-phosphogluconolactonase n=1 Tax=Dinghuibacter silviterrae TaxID=1539049 RepID=A0A4R8DUB7_9BACT|nr:lactonase family protein [Dinghuibacter silviterrae]TDX00741.1 6-phosphogluconolactonase [Dinghuibacter silviterrae]